mmetsp:Transcript_21225/g.39924  ORF Transcript_21225/g.39924 Transcript_21225/m.39924 type:complete len:397 (-) Transcript_21225:42-1232(-)
MAVLHPACKILVAVILGPVLAIRSSEGDNVEGCAPTETIAYNQVVIPTVPEFVRWRDALSTITKPLSQPITAEEGFVLDISMRVALLSYGRNAPKSSYVSFSAFGPKGEESPDMMEVLIRGEKEHKRKKSGDYDADDSPYAAVYVVKVADGKLGLILTFKGTSNVGDWLRNLDWKSVPLLDFKDVKVHRGFNKHLSSIFDGLADLRLREFHLTLASWGVEEDMGNLLDFVLKGKWSWCICTGHSLGAAMATIAAERITRASGRNSVYLVTVGGPITGNQALNAHLNSNVIPNGGLRIESAGDPVPWAGFNGVFVSSRQINGMSWTIPADPAISKMNKRGHHTLYHIETHETNGTSTCRFYTFQPHDAEGDAEEMNLRHYDQISVTEKDNEAVFHRL